MTAQPFLTSPFSFLIWTESFGGLAQLARAPALQAGGQRFESVILHSLEERRISCPFRSTLSAFLIRNRSLACWTRSRGKSDPSPHLLRCGSVREYTLALRRSGGLVCEKGSKGVRRMPRLSQAMKGVISCDKPGAGASDH